MASALVTWSQGRLRLARYVLEAAPHRVQHVVAWDGRIVLDGDGAMLPQEGVDKLALCEAMPGCILIDGYDRTLSPAIPHDEHASAWIARTLTMRLPDPRTRPWEDHVRPTG